MRDRRIRGAAGRRPDPPPGARPPGVPRLRLRGRRGRARGPGSRSARRKAGSPTSPRTSRRGSRARRASGTRAGPPTASRPRRTPTRRSTRRSASPSCTTASSRTPTSCAPSCSADGVEFALADRHRDRRPPDREGVRRRRRRPGARRAPGAALGRRRLRPRDLDAEHPDRIVVARNGSPVLLGIGEKEMFVASDVAALIGYTRQVVYLDDGELATITADGYRTYTLDDRSTAKSPSTIDWDVVGAEIGDHAHFLHQGDRRAAAHDRARALRGRLDERFDTAHLGGLNLDRPRGPRDQARQDPRLRLGLLRGRPRRAAHRGPRPRCPPRRRRRRSSATATRSSSRTRSTSRSASPARPIDTLAAVQELQRKGGRVIGIVNVVGSTIARQVDGGIYIHAGPEMSVAATKSFTSTVTAFALLALHLGRMRDLAADRGQADRSPGCSALPDADPGDPRPVRRRSPTSPSDRAAAPSVHVHRAAAAAGRWRGRARRSSRRSPTCTRRPTRRPSSSTGRSR